MKPEPKNAPTRMIFHLLTMVLALLLASSSAFAQGGARVYLQPVESPEGILVVDVIAENTVDMYGAEFKLKFDPTVLTVHDFDPNQEGIQIEAGTLLPSDQGFAVANMADGTDGTIVFATTLLNPAPPVTGSGPLARITFDVRQDVSAVIDVEKAKLVAVDLQTIPVEIIGLTVGAANPAETVAAVSTAADEAAPALAADSGFPWWIVALALMIIGFLAISVFAVWGSMGKTPSQRRNKSQATRRRSQTAAGARPSAFK